MKIDGKLGFVGYVGIKPKGTLSETAKALSKDLGATFYEDKEGKYDEYPAFCAEVLGLEFALLGIPKEDDELRDESAEYFVLQVTNLKKEKYDHQVDMSTHLVDWLRTDSDIECWILE